MVNLPLIDISAYLAENDRYPATPSTASTPRAQVAQAIHAACRDVGFFYIRIDPFITQAETAEVLSLTREFFARPEDEKQLLHLDSANGDGVRGWQRLNENITLGKVDHHEGLDLYAPSPYKGHSVLDGETTNTQRDDRKQLRPLEGENQWPANPPELKPTMLRWIDKMKVLGMAVMHAMADGLGMTAEEWDDMRSGLDDSFWVMRLIGYPPLPPGADGVSCGEHRDYGCLTLLLADPTAGALQVLPRYDPLSRSQPDNAPPELSIDSDTRPWLNADPIPNHLVVNIGDMMSLWTGGLYPATLHRVVHTSPTYRVSVPFFFEPNWGTVVGVLPAAKRKAAEEGVQLDETQFGRQVRYGDYLLGKVAGNFVKYGGDPS